jgi:hypothetical protein
VMLYRMVLAGRLEEPFRPLGETRRSPG